MIRPGSGERFLRLAGAILGDFCVAWATLAAAISLRRSVPVPFTRSLLPPGNLPLDALTVFLFGGAFVAALGLAGFYRLRVLPRARPIVMVALLIQVAMVAIGAAVLEEPIPRTILILVPLLEALTLPAWRWLQETLWPVQPRDTILVGDAPQITAAFAVVEAASDQRIRIVGCAGDTAADVAVPYLGRLDDASVRAAIREVDEVIYVGSEIGPHGRLELLRIRGPRGYLLLASHADALLISSVLGWMGDEPLIEVVIGCGYGVRAMVKRAIDIAVTLILTAITLPVFLLVAAVIWLDDRGPVLLRQPRQGLDGVPFLMWKFRSMRAETGAAGESDDGRVTRVGRLLRRYRLDELPQLVNVITGDMSLVGPRPERPEIAERILTEVPDFDLRCLVRPGIAGLAQILGEYDSRPAVKLRYDLTYMCSWTLWLDIRVLFSSIAAALSGSGV
jgi:lipopolysaccharide/colanic/teichoic acid biosynthesis glycosyltransferase